MPDTKPDFGGLRVLSLESRRAEEMGRLIRHYGGEPIVAPSMREVPLDQNRQAIEFASGMIEGRVNIVVLLTGVGTRILLRTVDAAGKLAPFLAALQKVPIVARGPKPVAVLAEVGLRPALTVPEPNTWRELLQALDENAAIVPLAGRRVAVQEYGVTNPELLAGLSARGAEVIRVPVYDWQLPEDTGPLRAAVQAIVARQVDVILFTTSVQVRHLMQMATEMKLAEAVPRACAALVVASIGPLTSDELRRHDIQVDLEPLHPKMGFLVNEAAARSAGLLAHKRGAANQGSE